MASRPRKRKAANYTGTQSNGNDAATQDMVEKCVAAILPTIRETIRDVISSQPTSAPQPTSTPQPQSSQDHTEFNSSTLQLLTGASTDTGNSTSPKQHEPGVARPVGLGVDPKIKANIFANEFVKFASLLPKSPFDADEKFKSIEKDGQLLFIKTTEAGQVRNLTTCTG